MHPHRLSWYAWLAVSSLLCLSASDPRPRAASPPAGRNVAQMKLVAFPGLPPCARAAIESGDPTKGPSVLLAKMAAGCTVPWHWHTPNEHLMLVSGVARVQMKGEPPLTLRAGGYALMPAHHVHQFRCVSACTMFVYSDTAFDIHYVDARGREITPAAALKAVGETAVQPKK